MRSFGRFNPDEKLGQATLGVYPDKVGAIAPMVNRELSLLLLTLLFDVNEPSNTNEILKSYISLKYENLPVD